MGGGTVVGLNVTKQSFQLTSAETEHFITLYEQFLTNPTKLNMISKFK